MKMKVSELRAVVRDAVNELVQQTAYSKPQVQNGATGGQKAAMSQSLSQVAATANQVVQYFQNYRKFAQGQKTQLQQELQRHQRNIKGWEQMLAKTSPGHELTASAIAKSLAQLSSMMSVPFGGMFNRTAQKAQQLAANVTKLTQQLQGVLGGGTRQPQAPAREGRIVEDGGEGLPDINAMAKMHPDELMKLSKSATNRFYGQTASLLANAFYAKAQGDQNLMRQYIERAKTAWLRSQETDADQEKRAGQMIKHVKDQGMARDRKDIDGVHHGIGPHMRQSDMYHSTGARKPGSPWK